MILLVAYCYHYLIHLFSLVGKGERKEVLKAKFFNIFNVNTLTKLKKKKKKKLVCPKGTNNRFFFFFNKIIFFKLSFAVLHYTPTFL